VSIAVTTVPQLDPRLGRQKAHDTKSLAFPLKATVDRSTWRDKSIRLYDPWPNPNQTVGNCTTCAKAMQLNAVGNRKMGVVLNMAWAMDAYVWETANDEFNGQYLPDDPVNSIDTGSSSLASCKAAQQYRLGGAYRWIFGGADEVVQTIMNGQAPSIGSWWYYDMFYPDDKGIIRPEGGRAGGHQYLAHGYWASRDLVKVRCWWGDYRDVWISRTDLDNLLRDEGDAHWQERVTT
jgi:hypothetical protein